MKPENRWSLWAFEEENTMGTHTETGERTPPDPFCETCGHHFNAYGQCYCDKEPEGEEIEFLGEEADS